METLELQSQSCYDHISDCLFRYQSGLNEDDRDYLQFSLDKVYHVYHWESENYVDGPRSESLLEDIQEMASSLNLVLPKISK